LKLPFPVAFLRLFLECDVDTGHSLATKLSEKGDRQGQETWGTVNDLIMVAAVRLNSDMMAGAGFVPFSEFPDHQVFKLVVLSLSLR
jgi:hypothetical protein